MGLCLILGNAIRARKKKELFLMARPDHGSTGVVRRLGPAFLSQTLLGLGLAIERTSFSALEYTGIP